MRSSFFICLFLLVSSFAALAADIPSERRVISSTFKTKRDAVRIAFFDADSTLRVAPSGSVSANSATDVAILPMVAPKLAILARDGYLIAIVSNQSGILHGYVTFETADAALKLCMQKLSDKGAVFHYYDFAEGEGEDRKPDIGMGKRLTALVKEKYGKEIDWKNSFMVGDSAWKKGVDTEPGGQPGVDFSNTDRLFAENLAKQYGTCTFKHPRFFFGWIKYGIKNFSTFGDVTTFLKEHPEFDPSNPAKPKGSKR